MHMLFTLMITRRSASFEDVLLSSSCYVVCPRNFGRMKFRALVAILVVLVSFSVMVS